MITIKHLQVNKILVLNNPYAVKQINQSYKKKPKN